MQGKNTSSSTSPKYFRPPCCPSPMRRRIMLWMSWAYRPPASPPLRLTPTSSSSKSSRALTNPNGGSASRNPSSVSTSDGRPFLLLAFCFLDDEKDHSDEDDPFRFGDVE